MQSAKIEESGQLSLLLGLLLLGVSRLSSLFALVVLDVFVVNSKSFVNFCPESSIILNTTMSSVKVFVCWKE
tara:strand:- start:281 stop:496 length:216 start_codon:yes stop_codon:yes gene_type:complete